MTSVSRYLPGETIPVVTGDANLYNGVLAKYSGSVDSATGYPIVVIDTALSGDTAGVVDCGRVEGQSGTSTSKYASGVVITVRAEGIVNLVDGGTGATVGEYAVSGASGTVDGTATYDPDGHVGRIMNSPSAGETTVVKLSLR